MLIELTCITSASAHARVAALSPRYHDLVADQYVHTLPGWADISNQIGMLANECCGHVLIPLFVRTLYLSCSAIAACQPMYLQGTRDIQLQIASWAGAKGKETPLAVGQFCCHSVVAEPS